MQKQCKEHSNMAKRTIKFRTIVLSNSNKQQVYAYYNKRKQHKVDVPKNTIYGAPFGTLQFWY